MGIYRKNTIFDGNFFYFTPKFIICITYLYTTPIRLLNMFNLQLRYLQSQNISSLWHFNFTLWLHNKFKKKKKKIFPTSLSIWEFHELRNTKHSNASFWCRHSIWEWITHNKKVITPIRSNFFFQIQVQQLHNWLIFLHFAIPSLLGGGTMQISRFHFI